MSVSFSTPVAHSLRVLRLVQARPGINAGDLAARLEVSDRAVRRHIATLRAAGVAIDSTPGRHGGYRIGRSTPPPPMLFESGEALGLVMAVLDGHHAAADPEDPVGSALDKLIGSLPTATARAASLVRDHARAAPDRGAARSDPAVVAQLAHALSEQRRVRLGYTTGTGRTIEIVADPWLIVVRHGRWYLLCHDDRPDAVRAYRIDRIDRIDTLSTTTMTGPPPHTDPVTLLEEHLATGWEHDTIVDFHAPLDAIRAWVRPEMGRLTSLHDRRCRLVGSTSNVDSYAAEWLAPIPFPYTVHGGPDLRAAVNALATRLAAAVAAHSQ